MNETENMSTNETLKNGQAEQPAASSADEAVNRAIEEILQVSERLDKNEIDTTAEFKPPVFNERPAVRKAAPKTKNVLAAEQSAKKSADDVTLSAEKPKRASSAKKTVEQKSQDEIAKEVTVTLTEVSAEQSAEKSVDGDIMTSVEKPKQRINGAKKTEEQKHQDETAKEAAAPVLTEAAVMRDAKKSADDVTQPVEKPKRVNGVKKPQNEVVKEVAAALTEGAAKSESGTKSKKERPAANEQPRETKAPKKKKKKAVPIHLAERYSPAIKKGLTAAQVEKRIEDRLTNFSKKKHGKSYPQIFFSNIFTFFNMIYILVFVAYIYFDLVELSRMLFIMPVAGNTFIAIFQEINSKIKLDRLSLVSAPMAEVIRDGVAQKVPVNQVVLDDLVIYGSGKQIAADAIVEDGYLEVDESLLTGESEPVSKRKGEMIFAGSYVLSGHCVARTEKIGSANYVQGLTAQAKRYQKPRSQLLKTLNGILTAIAIIIIPVAVFSFLNNYNIGRTEPEVLEGLSALQFGILKSSGNVVSMIPVGPFLLTSLTLAVSIMRLAARNMLVQELYCIEMLARVDVLCFDKTGTITDGTMSVENLIEIKNDSKFTVEQIIGSMLNALEDNNMTSMALLNKFGTNKLMKKSMAIPFSSARKFSAVSFNDGGTYFLGAPEFVLPGGTPKTDAIIKKYAEKGYRILMLGYSTTAITRPEGEEFKIPMVRRPVALIIIEDRIRPDAIETIRWFKQNDVEIKVISGDNPISVAEIARKVGIENSNVYISLDGMNEEQVADAAGKYTVFGRVSPEQKAILVKSLRNIGKTVAMTGDGVNDILAMKEADCSIAMAAGSDAARNVAHLVLVDNNFGSMPKVVAEGRRVVNNIQSVAALYYMKIIFTIVLTIFTLIAGMPYPFDTSNMLLMEIAIVAIPTTLLALQPNLNIIRGRFLVNVMRRAIPFALVFIVQTGIIYILNAYFVPMPSLETVLAYCYILSGLFALYFCCKPLNTFRGILLGFSALIIIFGIIFLGDFMKFKQIGTSEILVVLIIVQLAFTLMTIFTKVFDKIKLN